MTSKHRPSYPKLVFSLFCRHSLKNLKIYSMYQNKSISDLTHDELVNAMKDLNLNVGPITSSTRRIYENRLKSHLNQKSINTVQTNAIEDKDIDKTDSVQNGPSDNITLDEGDQNNCIEGKHNLENLSTDKSVEDVPSNSMFFGVWIPYSPTRLVDKSKPNVFRSREDALKRVKECRGSRFKSFPRQNDAESFSLTLPSPCGVDKMCSFINNESLKSAEIPKTIIKWPSFQELMKFRRSIEEDDLQFVKQCLSNPKYLISSSDMPVILQEGTRLNAIHVAVKYNKLNMCRHLMQTIQSNEFLCLMYPNSPEDLINFRKKHLMDLYLNTPEKIVSMFKIRKNRVCGGVIFEHRGIKYHTPPQALFFLILNILTIF